MQEEIILLLQMNLLLDLVHLYLPLDLLYMLDMQAFLLLLHV